MKNNLELVLKNIISDELSHNINEDYLKYKDKSLLSLGVDSLSSMELIIQIESIYIVDIDYENIDMKQLDTLGKLDDYISYLLDLKNKS